MSDCGAPWCAAACYALCIHCDRRLCVWHSAGQPVDVRGRVTTLEACFPACASDYWRTGHSEMRRVNLDAE